MDRHCSERLKLVFERCIWTALFRSLSFSKVSFLPSLILHLAHIQTSMTSKLQVMQLPSLTPGTSQTEPGERYPKVDVDPPSRREVHPRHPSSHHSIKSTVQSPEFRLSNEPLFSSLLCGPGGQIRKLALIRNRRDR